MARQRQRDVYPAALVRAAATRCVNAASQARSRATREGPHVSTASLAFCVLRVVRRRSPAREARTLLRAYCQLLASLPTSRRTASLADPARAARLAPSSRYGASLAPSHLITRKRPVISARMASSSAITSEPPATPQAAGFVTPPSHGRGRGSCGATSSSPGFRLAGVPRSRAQAGAQ